MATSKIQVTEGSGKNVATNSFTEDAVTKEVGRQVLNDSAGAELKGSKVSASSIPVVIASDQASVPVAATLQASSGTDIGKLTANQSVNQAQIAGTTTDTNSGNKSAGTQRIVIATDQPTMTNPQPVTLTSTTITGTVTVDDLAAAPTGAAVPANAQYQGNLAQTALPTAASAGNLTGALGDKFGRTVVIPGTLRDLVGTQTTTISASTAETTVVTAAASTFNDLTAIIISNTSATATRVDFRDTTAGSVLFSFYVPAGDTRGATYNRPLPQTSVNTNWTAQSSASITDLRIYCVFDKNR